MNVDAIGDPWTPRDARAVDRRVRWLQVAPLLRSDFPAETLAELARGRRLLLRRARTRAQAAGRGRSSSTQTSTATSFVT